MNWPVWYSMLVADCIGIWLIAAIMLRERRHNKEMERVKLSLPRALRVRRAWKTVRVAVQLTTVATGKANDERGGWLKNWGRFTK